ncbi:MAG: glutamate--tRNA ligase [Candidatus Nanogingivalaceae bacterium]|nr:glutamate--tRNA ligase [Candidatus Nanogingivalaceae bacterium]
MTVRTRFAPSPTGYIHVGNVRSALYPYLIARQTSGQFILRIEDTDQARFVEGAEGLIKDTLNWLGLNWDEGPVFGQTDKETGDFGPYHQTSRREIYLKWARELIDRGLAYADPYSPEEVQAFRNQAKSEKRAFLYRQHRPNNPPEWRLGMPLRFRVPEIKRYTWRDAVMGEMSAGPEALDDFILIKADGLPTYNFAHIVDDFEMKITHVIRGAEYVASMPKYLSLYEALGFDMSQSDAHQVIEQGDKSTSTPQPDKPRLPIFAHVPHILAPSGNKKLGKRDGAKSVTEYRDEGILPEAMINFLAQLGWNDGTEQDVYSLNELIEKFSLDRVQRSGARFDEQRLIWLNGQWIRRLELDDLYDRVSDLWSDSAINYDEAYKRQVLALAQDRLKTLCDLPNLTSYFFEEPPIDEDLITNNKQLRKLTAEERRDLLETARTELAKIAGWTPEDIQNCLNELLEITGQKPGILFSLIRIVVTWAPFSPQLNDTLALIGRERTLIRLQEYLNL